MREPVVRDKAWADAEVARLTSRLRQRRLDLAMTTRHAAAEANINLGTLFRLEHGRNHPRLLPFLRLATALGLRLEVDDGRERPRTVRPDAVPLPPGTDVTSAVVPDRSPASLLDARAHFQRVRVGAELWWARYLELDPPLDGAAVCRLLGISHHTLTGVEWGPVNWPYLSSVVRVAALTGRRLELCDASELLRTPPWAASPD